MALPSLVKAEVKLTTGAHISVSARELDALEVAAEDAAGIVAALFVGGGRDADGRWVIVDAVTWRGRAGESMSTSRSSLVSIARGQPQLDELRQHVDELWPAFLEGWKDVAARGHEELVTELEGARREGKLGARLPRFEILAFEHRSSVAKLVDRHGEAEAGRLAQDLLAYLVAFAGYARVTNNPVGVPDFVVEGRHEDESSNATVTLTNAEARRLLELCSREGDIELAGRLRVRLSRP